MPLFFDPDQSGALPARMTRAFHPGWDPLFTDGIDLGSDSSDATSRGPQFRARGGLVSNLRLHRDDEDVKEAPAPFPFPSASNRPAAGGFTAQRERITPAGPGHEHGMSQEHRALVSEMDAVFDQMGAALDALAEDLDAIPFPKAPDDDDGPWAA